MEKTTQRFQKIANTLADLNAEGLKVQTVNNLITIHVGAASQHVLFMSIVSEQESRNFDRQVMTFSSHLMHREKTFSVFSTHQAWRTVVGSAVQRHAAAPWRAWQLIIPTLMATSKSPDTDSFFSSKQQLRSQLAQLQTTLSQQKNHNFTQTTWSSLPPQNHSKKSSFHHPKKHTQATLQQLHRHTH